MFLWENPKCWQGHIFLFLIAFVKKKNVIFIRVEITDQFTCLDKTNAPVWKGFIDFALTMVGGDSTGCPLPRKQGNTATSWCFC